MYNKENNYLITKTLNMYYSVFWQYQQAGTWYNSHDHCTTFIRGLERFEQMQSLAEEMPHAYRNVTCTFTELI